MSSVTASGNASWWRSAACQAADPELFFPGTASKRVGEQVEHAKAVCRTCQVNGQCLRYAIAHGEAYGIWGGMTEFERLHAIRHGLRIRRPADDAGGPARYSGERG